LNRYRKWGVIAAAMVVNGLGWTMTLTSFTLFAGAWITTFRATHGQVMWANTAMMLGLGLFGPLVGFLVGKFSIRTLMSCGAALMGAALYLESIATHLWQIIFLQAFPVALAMALVSPVLGQVLAVRLFQPKPGLAVGIVSLSQAIASLFIPPLVVHGIASEGWRATLALLSGLCMLLLLPVSLFLIPPTETSHDSGRRSTGAALLSPVQILTDRVLIGAMLVVLSLLVLFDSAYYTLGPYMTDMGCGPEHTRTLLTLVAVASAAGVLAVGLLSERVDARLLWATVIVADSGAFVVSALGAGYRQLLFSLPIMGFATSALAPLLAITLARRFGPENFARADGIGQLRMLMAFSVALAGIGRDALGSYPAVFRLMLAALIPCLIGMALLSGRQRPRGGALSQGTEGS
jgi:MFS family permease